MTETDITAFCQGLPGAECSEPFGPGIDVWKVGDKIFAALGANSSGVSVKTPGVEEATLLIDLGRATRAPYFHRSWVRVPLDTPADELTDRIATSYRLIRASLTKKRQASLPPL